MTSSTHFDELVQNALDFLETAFSEFEEKPKYSVIHFCTAIELLLKARLMHEHWSLIVDGSPDIKKFKQGDFKSISFKDLVTKIENVLDERIPAEVRKCFDGIANHRNKMVHFFHQAESAAKKKVIEEIALEQCTAWFHLRRLLEKWSKVFSKYEKKIAVLNAGMKRHRVFLQAVYNNIEKEISDRKKKGILYRACSNCGFEASRMQKLTENVFACSCEVCLLNENVLQLECTECGKQFDVGDPEKCQCPYCQTEMSRDEVDNQINTDPTTTDNYFDKVVINCAACSGADTVVQHHDYFICLECFETEKKMDVCEWCNEGQIAGGDMEFSYQKGCEFCDGHADWTRDD